MGLISEFKEFALKGNVVDLAVGVIIGGAFGKIISSFVADIVMPPIGLLVGGLDFKEMKFVLKAASVGADGKAIEAVTLNYGTFVQTTVDFLIVAFVIFMVIKAMNKMKKEPLQADVAPPAQELLLGEIRDILKQNATVPRMPSLNH